MLLKVGKSFGNTYVSNISGNNNATNQMSLRLNRSEQAYNTNYPRTISDFSQECFTDGYYIKADNLDFLA